MTSVQRALLPLLGFLGLVVFFAFGLTRDPSLLPSEMIDRPLPEFELTELYKPNSIITQDTLVGDITLINIFGSWCVACVVEHPKLMEISQQGAVKLIGVDWRDSRERGRRWLQKNGDPYELVIFDEKSRLAIDLGVTGAPESFLIDKSGQIRYKHIGIITDEVWEDILHPIILNLKAET